MPLIASLGIMNALGFGMTSGKKQYIAISEASSPRVSAYVWSGSGFGVKLANPSSILGSGANSVMFNPKGTSLAVSETSTPYLATYAFRNGFGTKYVAASPPAGVAYKLTYDATGKYLAVSVTVSPAVSVYLVNASGSIGSKYSNPGTVPAGSGTGVSFSYDSATIAVSSSSSPYISVYPWNPGFGTKYANPATLPASGTSTVFNNDKTKLVVGADITPFIYMYNWSLGFGTKVSDPGSIPPDIVNNVTINPAGTTIALAVNASPYVLAYSGVSGGFGTKYANPATLPTGAPYGVSFNFTGTQLAYANTGINPFVTAYPWNPGFGAKYSSPSTPVGSAASGISISPLVSS